MGKTTTNERFKTDNNPMVLCPHCHGSGKPLGDVRGFWLRKKKIIAFLIEYLRKEFDLDKTKISVRKFAKSAGIIFTSYNLKEFQESSLSRDLIASEEDALLVKSILLEKGLSADGLIETFELRKKIMSKELVVKRKVWWGPVPGATSYVVYFSEDVAIFEPDNFFWETTPGIISKPVIGKTELILPDDWPEFPKEPGTYYIGITSRDDLGNQSYPFIVSGSFKFHAPPAPSQGGIESL